MKYQYTDGLKLFKKNAAEWAMSIFFEAANTSYGFMERYMYDFLEGHEVQRGDNEFVYMPEDEFLKRISSDTSIMSFKETYYDCLKNVPDRTPWLEKIRYRSMMSDQLDLDPEACVEGADVHRNRKILVARWFQALRPYLENYELSCRAFFPGVISSITFRLKKSVKLLSDRDEQLGLRELDEIRSALDAYTR